jgi:hypothetical protein
LELVGTKRRTRGFNPKYAQDQYTALELPQSKRRTRQRTEISVKPETETPMIPENTVMVDQEEKYESLSSSNVSDESFNDDENNE